MSEFDDNLRSGAFDGFGGWVDGAIVQHRYVFGKMINSKTSG
ncbi:hypothetical protein QT970_09995 [Microcoleus sp. herbarium8]